jgi:transposase InsO family protein
VTGILRRHRLLDPAPPPRGYLRFEHDAPNRLWQMDFKGWFALSAGTRCHTLGVLDDHSRFNLVLAACPDERTATVTAQLTTAFRRYGLPERILCDNGPPWGNDRHQPWTPLGVWLLDRGVAVVHSRPFHPQTAGKEERFHLTLDWEVISTRAVWENHPQVQQAYDRWRVVYNHQRPHQALGMAVPADRYQPSPRSLPGHIPPVDYPQGFAVRKHTDKGLSYQGRRFRLPKAFNGRYLGITPTTPDGSYQVWYRHQIITTIDLTTTP